MMDEVDTTTRWRCPECGEVLEEDYAQMTVRIKLHELRCPKRAPSKKEVSR
ncbi:hypothetical protein LCGC14_2371060 [marine sediment metagenome]|uniref:Uncharacterized protein n=1 Tax=marine sediment metagenome TaxID=412755 RepID=A0A0F9EG92_9ZZZZ